VLLILTLPVTVLTLGLFYFVISAFCLWLTSYFLAGFDVHGAFTTIIAAILVSVVSTVATNTLQNASGNDGQKSNRR
jgi:putative membrane protein